MLDDILEFIFVTILSSLPGKILSWVISIIFIILGICVYSVGRSDIAYWILSVGVLFMIIAVLITAFGRRKDK